MKRICALIAALLLLASTAIAEMDLSAMSYEDLINLSEQVKLEIWIRAETKAVTVPAGYWEVGVDIPAGTYTIKCADYDINNAFKSACTVKWYKENPLTEKTVYQSGSVIIYHPDSKFYKEGQTSEYTMTFYNGMFIEIDDIYNQAVFYPNTGRQNLGFDW